MTFYLQLLISSLKSNESNESFLIISLFYYYHLCTVPFGSINSSNQNSSDDSNSLELNSLENENNRTSESDRDEDQAASNQRRESYNISLPVTHSYLGNDLEELGEFLFTNFYSR